MIHEFWLLQTNEWSYSPHHNIHALRKHPTHITLHDTILWYMSDSLEWIETANPAMRNQPGYGLNMYGLTMITEQGATRFESVLTTWAALFCHGPETLRLTGEWMFYNPYKGKRNNGRYEVIMIERDPLVTTLRTLAEYARSVQAGQHFILHFGL